MHGTVGLRKFLVPYSLVARQAEILLGIGELAHEFDHVTSYLVQWVEHQQVSGGSYARLPSSE